MYKILLTDDEQIVIDSLSFIINKNFEGQVQVFTALSGTEAIEISTKEDIDIIFMDINMPGLSGLDTISCILKLKPNIAVIILSAFDRFQYAQEAMNLGAFKYITKPVNRNTVIQTIRSAMDLIDSRQGASVSDTDFHKKLDLISPMIESDFIYACLFTNDKAIDISAYLDYFNLSNSDFCVICLEVPKIDPANQYETFLKIREILNRDHRVLVSSFMLNRIIALYPVEKNASPQEVLEQIQKMISNLSFNFSAGIRTGVSHIFTGSTDFSTAYNEAVAAIIKTDEAGGIQFAYSQSELQDNTRNIEEFKKQLLVHLRQGDANGIKSFLSLYTSELFEAQKDLNVIKNNLFELIITARNVTNEIIKDLPQNTFDNVFSVLSSENNLTVLKEFTQKCLLECESAIASRKAHVENPVIKKVCDYLNMHLSEDLSLEQMADFANVSSFYLSKLFKEEKGVTFINFISDRRLEKTRELLKNTDLSIKEITTEVGYNDQNYLSRIFKNRYGLSPSEYRNSL